MEELAIEAARQMKEKGVDLGDISRSVLSLTMHDGLGLISTGSKENAREAS